MMKTIPCVFLLVTVVWAKQHIQSEVGVNIINGKDAFPGQFPFIASIQHKTLEDYSCTGALIDHRGWVLTAKSCFGFETTLPASDFRVVLGLHDFKDESSEHVLVFDITRIVGHKEVGTYRGNFVLLKLSSPVPLDNPYVQSVAIAEFGDDFLGTYCNMVGWGTRSSAGPWNDILQYQTASILSRDGCAAKGYNEEALNWNVCTYDGVSGTCAGDRGTPLICRKDNITYLVGTSNYSTERCSPEHATLFLQLSVYKTYIHYAMKQYA